MYTGIFERRDATSWWQWNSWDCRHRREFQAAGQRWKHHLLLEIKYNYLTYRFVGILKSKWNIRFFVSKKKKDFSI